MRIPTTARILLAGLLLLALAAPSARANATDNRIVEDCQTSATGLLTGSYTKAQLNHALHNLPSDVSEYTGCHDAIKQAMSSAGGGGGGKAPSGGGGGTGGDGSGGGGGGGGSNGAGGAGGTGGAGSGNAAPDPAAMAAATPPPGAQQPVELAGAAVAPGALPEIGRDAHALPPVLLVLLALLAVAALVPAALTIGRRVVARRRP